ncbi:MAG: WYL domain-containing protein [Zetaproteobacteria bacterium]|nr:WYL domain-containing protein [Zetaproteobacteria bacterium]
MDSVERTYHLDQLLKSRRTPISLLEICDRFACSESTAKRTIEKMRNLLGAPILNIPNQGYFYSKNSTFEMPGVWFSAEELHALLTMQQLAAGLSGGFLESELDRLRERIESILKKSAPMVVDQMHRLRMMDSGRRSRAMPLFPLLATAVMQRQRLHLEYEGRQKCERSAREVSPQRLVHYRGNWYLDVWCHKSDGLRTFAIERVRKADRITGACLDVDEDTLNRELASAFGIFAGAPTAEAVLLFTAKAAAWVADEQWFPDAQGKWLEDGRFELRIPYSNPTELIMEICRYGPEVEVLDPPELRQQVAAMLQRACDQYACDQHAGKVTI